MRRGLPSTSDNITLQRRYSLLEDVSYPLLVPSATASGSRICSTLPYSQLCIDSILKRSFRSFHKDPLNASYTLSSETDHAHGLACS